MKLDIFTWIPASSAGMTMLLFAAQLNAAGVCIICPPGHVCPEGQAPFLPYAGVGTVLVRTDSGMSWRYVGSALFAQGATGDQLLHEAICPPPPSTTNSNVVIHSRCAGIADPSALQTEGHGVLGQHCWCQMENRDRPHCRSRWVRTGDIGSPQSCANLCMSSCAYFNTTWRANASW